MVFIIKDFILQKFLFYIILAKYYIYLASCINKKILINNSILLINLY
jgi:hypothetical protein